MKRKEPADSGERRRLDIQFRIARRGVAGDSAAVNFGATSLRRGWLWPLAIALLIIVASSRSTVAGPPILHFDKVVHFSIYGLLATLVCRQGRGWQAAGWSLLAVSAFGASDEWHQYFVPGRTCEWGDWIADTAGAALAVALYVGWDRYRQWLEQPVRTRRGRA
jgi:VanZ family protein